VQTTFPLHSPDSYAGDPYPAHRELRAKFWALLTYEDVRFASSNPALFSPAKGITIPTIPDRRGTGSCANRAVRHKGGPSQ
jgi:cytochrome P450